MSHEIYYTSAPEGMKRGSSGFCTVAASENIPRALGDRLETLSAYRHHFSVDGSAPGGTGQNPVSLAHWILSVTGKTHHVLSRVCDSGVDHTQRTNAFAHHLVLDSGEMESAAGGPAWLLSQGVMAGSWDGRVGALSPSAIPGGSGPGPGICRGWANFTGDAGWGGHLADLFVKSPSRPVCILFSPGQDLLPLLAESIALLPTAARWNVTFNTYFTSMPTSATCLWRCCLAGTPAAQVGVRYAANGLILDLTDRNRLPALPMGPLVTVARTGQVAEVPGKAVAKPGPKVQPARGVPAPLGKGTPKRPVVEEVDEEEEQLERQRAALFEFTPQDEAQIEGGAAQDPYELAAPSTLEAAAAAAARSARRGPPERIMKRADDAILEAEEEADRAAARRRKQVMYLFGGALAALALGTVLIMLNGRRGAAPPEVPVAQPRIVTPARPTVVPEQIPTTTITVVATAPVDTLPTVVVQTQVAPLPTPVVPARHYPETIMLSGAIERPNLAGIGDKLQSFPVAAADLDRPGSITAMQLHLPQGKTDGGADNTFTSEALGTFTATEVTKSTRPAVAIMWKPAGSAGGGGGAGTEIMLITFDRTRPGLELTWHTSQLLKNPDLYAPIFWLLQNSTLELSGTPAHEKNQRLALKPWECPTLSPNDAAITIRWPVDLPAETSVVAPKAGTLPAGWEATWYTDWETKDPTLRSAANALQVLKFRKPGPAGVDAWFLLTFQPGLSKVESTFGKRLASDQADLVKYQGALSALETEVTDAQGRIGRGDTLENYPSGRDLLARRDQAQQQMDSYKAVVAAYHDLPGFDVSFDQPDGLRLATVHFKQSEPP